MRAQAPRATKTFQLPALVSFNIVADQLLDLSIRVEFGLGIGGVGRGRCDWAHCRYAQTSVGHVLGALAARALGRAEANLSADLVGTLAH